MKKSLFLAALAAVLGLASCSNEDNASEGLNQMQQNVVKYGKKSSEVDATVGSYKLNWVDVNSNMWTDMPDVITEEESQGIIKAIQDGTAVEVTWPGYTKFYVQSIVNGGAHHIVTGTNTINGTVEGPFDATNGFELAQIKVDDAHGGWLVINNYAEGRIKNSVSNYAVLIDGTFEGAKALDEKGGSCIEAWKLFYWNGNYYLGFDFYINAANKILPPDGIYDDSILKIIPSGEEKKDPTPVPDPEPQPEFKAKKGEIEFDVEQQEHNSWKEIKTSIHLRDSVNARIFIPVPQEYQALADDFAIRLSDQYEYIKKEIKILNKTYTINMTIAHKSNGIEILLYGTEPEAKEAIRMARGLYDDGITLEVHSYVYGFVSNATVWSWLKEIECVQSTKSGDPKSGDCCTYTYGQVHSAFYPTEQIDHKKDATTVCPACK